jgi:hypothetical protein
VKLIEILRREQVEEVLVEGHPSSANLDDYFFESIAESSGHIRDFQRSIVGNKAELINARLP